MTLSLALLTALFSVLHGANRMQKGWAIVFHALACSGAAWMLPPHSLLLSGAAGVLATLYWVVLRRGRQAKAELHYLSGNFWVGLDDIAHGYLPVLTGVPGMIWLGHYWLAGLLVFMLFLPMLVSAECTIRTEFGRRWQARDKAYADKHGKARFFEMRRASEIASGLTGGIWIATLVILVQGVI